MLKITVLKITWSKIKNVQLVIFVATSILLYFSVMLNFAVADLSRYLRPADVPVPIDNQQTQNRIALGKKLFFDPRLSGSNWISCGTCHNPALGWSDGLPTAIGHGQKVLGRATPTILNTAYNKHQFWDGRADTLEQQALGPIAAAGEMNQDLDELVKELSAIKGYEKLFKAAYPQEGISKKTIGKAIASFERTINSTESRFDRWIKGEKNAMNKSEIRGFNVFEGKGLCASCHSGFNFSDGAFHNIGLKDNKDPGRFAVTKDKSLVGALKTPTLRDISLTAPYMHNGEYKTLAEVVNHYDRGGDSKKNISPLMIKLNLSKQEKKDLVAFMESLTGVAANVEIPRLPTN